MEEGISYKQRLDWGTAYTVKGTSTLLFRENVRARCALALASQFPDGDGVVAVVLSPGCEFGFGLPNGSPELPSFSNGKMELPARPKIRLTKSHASDKSPVTLSRGCHASCGRWVAAASGPAMRRNTRRRGATRRRGRIMRCSFPGGQGRRHNGCRTSALPIHGALKDGHLVRQKVQSADQRGQGRKEGMGRRALFLSGHHLCEGQSSLFTICSQGA